MIPLWQGSVHITRKNVLASRCLRLSLSDEKVPPHTPTSPLRLFWWSGSAKVLLVYASLLQMYCCDQACVFGTFHTLFEKLKLFHLPFLTLPGEAFWSHPRYHFYLFLLRSLDWQKDCFQVIIKSGCLLPAWGSFTQHSKQCFRFPFFTFFSRSASRRFLLLMFVYFTAYKQLRSDSQLP